MVLCGELIGRSPVVSGGGGGDTNFLYNIHEKGLPKASNEWDRSMSPGKLLISSRLLRVVERVYKIPKDD